MRLASATARQVKKAQGAAARLATLLLGAALVAGCAGERPVFLPPDPPRQPAALQGSAAGTATQREHQRLMQAFGGEYRAPAAKRAVDEIVAKLAAASGSASYNYEVTLLNSPVVNAFALPTGRLYLTRGLLALANDRAEIASVIAHEIAHVQARHGAERAELQQRSELVQRVVSQVLGPRGGRARAGALEALARQLLAPAGAGGRHDSRQGHRRCRLRPLWRLALPRLAGADHKGPRHADG
jgi:predicted Zn-dependent protease